MTPKQIAIREKKNRVLRLLRSPKWRSRSTNWIALQAGVSWLFVDKIRVIFEQEVGELAGKRESRAGQRVEPTHESRRRYGGWRLVSD